MANSSGRQSGGLKSKLNAFHQKMGDFWWYSLLLFCACRFADVLNAFVGLWLVPKYVPPSELGAVMPLMQFANFLAIPIAAFSNTFRNELTQLSIKKEFGKLKTLMRGVFIASAVFIFIATLIAHFALPAFLERIRIAEGSLGLIIIATSFVSAISPIYSNALQALKKFKAQSLISIIGAPIRLITMLITMPFRALSGYFIGQASVPVFSMAASVIALKKELSVKAEPYWDKETVKKFTFTLLTFLTWGTISGFYSLVESTIIRQRLPDLDSAGYYIATRFSDIAGFLAATLSFTLFPFAAEKSASREDPRPLIIKSIIANGCFCILLAVPFSIIGQQIFSILPHADKYIEYFWVVPWLIAIVWISSIYGFYSMSEVAGGRFGFLKWAMPLELIYSTLLLIISGHGYFSKYIPTSWTYFLTNHNIYSLKTMLYWMMSLNVIKGIFCIVSMLNADHRTRL